MEALMESFGEAKFRAKQLFDWIHEKNVVDFTEIKNLGKNLLTKLEMDYTCSGLHLKVRQKSVDGTEKFLFELQDGQAIECVLMRYRGDKSKKRNTLCISSQVGCAMGCTFCATGQGGFVRNLSAGEIVGQVYEVNHILKAEGEELPVGNVVYMGMGEPMLNFEQFIKSAELLHHEKGQNISYRRMTVSTCGIVGGILKLAEIDNDMVLAISLHASNNKERSQIMPINNRYPLEDVLSACKEYQKRTKKRLTFEYALIKGVNDSDQHIKELKQLLQGLDCHLNIIPVNPVTNVDMERPEKNDVRIFVQKLEKVGLNGSIREEKGKDIDGACGQLRGKLTTT